MKEKYIEELNNEISSKINNFIEEIKPFVDTIQIFCTRHQNDEVGTYRFINGTGNYFARFGQVKQWADNGNDYREE